MDTPALPDEPGIEVRFLDPEGAAGFTRLVRRCYGDSYDAAWVYDPEPIESHHHRQSVVLDYLKTNEGHTRPVSVPPRDRKMVEIIIERAALRGAVDDAADAPSAAPSDLHVEDRDDHNDRVVTVRTVGDDLLDALLAARDDALERAADCVYVDLPLADRGTQHHGDGLHELGFTFGGIFPNRLHAYDVLRYQYLDRITLDTSDISLASDHGRELLDDVTA